MRDEENMPTTSTSTADALNVDLRHAEALLRTGALQSAIFNSANFSSIATDARGVILLVTSAA
jgi:hypothetical protein